MTRKQSEILMTLL